ncbi:MULTISPECIES: Do family serine endopeptidase [Prevotellaceae]|uniref:Do family serine endopeptidase n=1 Tax=Leyella stercorea TaxID=363265 RepID=UPI001F2BD39A|nr:MULTISPECIES: Do family serine endopeptidase [Prevotellaceae]MCF2580018.1 Do family serine endopeptidase [Leyella stercorea]MCI7183012.1 Do family serine endopeptidase [Prevotella sp.]
MKKYSKYLVVAMSALAFAFSTGTLIKVNATQAPSTAVPAQPVDLTYAAEKSLPSVVHILSTKNSKVQTIEVQSDPFSDFFSDPFGFFGNPNQSQDGKQKRSVRTPKQQGSGSGVIISTDGYIVTNNHVVADADELTVTLNDNKEYSARIIGTDKTTDLALIKIDAKDLPAITIANSENIKVGEWVLAVGNPFNLTNTVTAGIVSAKGRSLYQNGVESFIQTDAAINPGNSGGALVNTRGELIGINAMLYSQTGSFSGYGFAIPTSIMNKVVDDLKKYGTVQRAVIGIQGQDVKNYVDAQKDQGKDVDLGTMEGIYVAKVLEESSAEEAGLKAGDVITAIDGKEMNKMADLQEYLAKKRPGDKVSVSYLRDKKKASKTMTLKNEQGNTQVVKKADLDVLGGNFRAITDGQKKQLNIGYGLEVLKVNSGKFKDAGITKGFIIQRVNDSAVKTIEDLQNLVKEASTSRNPVLYIQGVYPTGKKAYFAVPLED